MHLIQRIISRSSSGLKYIKNHSYAAEKVFCVGRNKTGTTSINRALRDLGYRVAPQEPAEWLTEKWSKRDFRDLSRFCLRYDVFQDVPFSYPFTFQEMDQRFPNAKFILTVRDSDAYSVVRSGQTDDKWKTQLHPDIIEVITEDLQGGVLDFFLP